MSLQDAAARRKVLYNSRLRAISLKCDSLYANIGSGKFALEKLIERVDDRADMIQIL